jgi:glycosyltransferase involved in cell wall biosynthesis
MKDVPLFLRSARAYLDCEPDAHIIMCGAGMRADNAKLLSSLWSAFGGMHKSLPRIHLLGVRHDMEAIYAAADVVSLTSAYGETYPLVLLEGMACGAIPVSTDVGDARMMLEGCGIVTPRDPGQIAAAWQWAYQERDAFALHATERNRLGREAMIMAYADVIDRYRR